MEFQTDTLPIKEYHVTDQGYLRFIAPIARVGKLLNFNKVTKKPYYQIVTKEVLINSAETFKFQVITDGHPKDEADNAILVNAENAQQYQKGLTQGLIFFDGNFLWGSGVVTDGELVQEILNKRKRQISPGYQVALKQVDTSDFEQIKRVGNHIAFLPYGRSGSDVGVNIDEFEEYQKDLNLQIDHAEIPQVLITGNEPIILTVNNDSSNAEVKMKTIKIGDVEFQIDEAGFDIVTNLETTSSNLQLQVDTLTTQIQSVNQARTALAAQLAELMANQKPQAQIDTEELNNQIAQRLALWSMVEPAIQADKADFKANYSLTPNEIKAVWIKHQLPNLIAAIDAMDHNSSEFAAFIHGAYTANPPKEIKPKTQTDEIFAAMNLPGNAGVNHSSVATNVQGDEMDILMNSLTADEIASLQVTAYGNDRTNTPREEMIARMTLKA